MVQKRDGEAEDEIEVLRSWLLIYYSYDCSTCIDQTELEAKTSIWSWFFLLVSCSEVLSSYCNDDDYNNGNTSVRRNLVLGQSLFQRAWSLWLVPEVSNSSTHYQSLCPSQQPDPRCRLWQFRYTFTQSAKTCRFFFFLLISGLRSTAFISST